MGELITPSGKIAIDCEPGQISDGYHTFNELYEHRCLLFALLVSTFDDESLRVTVFKTRKNDKGEEWPGWFIVGMNTAIGQISYHLPDKLWDLVEAPVIDRNYYYDGHTSADAIDRMRRLLEEYWTRGT